MAGPAIGGLVVALGGTQAALIANTEDAVNRGAFGIPTFFVDGAIYFGKDRLRDVEDAIA